ncbi:MAG: hypothetical protein MUF07_05510 [Steroidobacteraceae bacterium]|jgi:hypothetical protein|nr:hypothetical protein [Steroidobacteraceae bacterium]
MSTPLPPAPRPADEWPWLLGLAALVAGAWAAGLTPLMHWGDDWAGYLLQARALVEGRVDAELATNTVAMDGGDVQIGPYAYPWGYPLLLAAAGLASGWSIVGLKAVGGLSLLVLAASTYALARLHVGRALAVFATLAVAMQPAVVLDASYLGSDVPFTALSALALLLVFMQWRRAAAGQRWSTALMLSVALVGASAFAVRSNGAVIPCTYAAMLGLAALRGSQAWRATLLHGAAFAAVMSALVALYFAALPDGSLVHASYLTTDPGVWARRALAHVHAIATWVTFKTLLGPGKLLPLGLMLALMAWGVLRRPWEGAIALVYLALHLALLTVFPFDGGERYYHPLLPAAGLLLVFGCAGAREALARRLGAERARSLAQGLAVVAPALVALLMLVKIRTDQQSYADPGVEAPFAPATTEVMTYVREHAPAGARIAFFRPRAFRLLTDRVAFAINQPQNLDRVDWYVFNGGTSDPRTQVQEPPLRASGAFRLEYDRPPYRIYVRRPTAGPSPRGIP